MRSKLISLFICSALLHCISYSQSSIICYKADRFALKKDTNSPISGSNPTSAIYIINAPKMELVIIDEKVEVFTILEKIYRNDDSKGESYQYIIRKSPDKLKMIITFFRSQPTAIVQTIEGNPLSVIIKGNEIPIK